jgi:hypothetical protein
MREKGVALFLFGWLLYLLAGCAQTLTPDVPKPTEIHPVESPTPPTIQPSPGILFSLSETPAPPTQVARVTEMENASQPAPYDPALKPLVDQAMLDLALRLGVTMEQIEVVEAQAVVWPDASLGCPQPGMVYIQLPLDGTLMRLKVKGMVYEYHSGGNRDPFLCKPTIKAKSTSIKIDIFKTTPPPRDAGGK